MTLERAVLVPNEKQRIAPMSPEDESARRAEWQESADAVEKQRRLDAERSYVPARKRGYYETFARFPDADSELDVVGFVLDEVILSIEEILDELARSGTTLSATRFNALLTSVKAVKSANPKPGE